MLRTQKLLKFLLIFLFLANFLSWLALYQVYQPGLLQVTFFDVGQGDSIFIETASGNQILVDGGPSSAVLEKLAKEMSFWDRTIDLVILTHPESDHLFGLLAVLETYKVENILWTGVIKESKLYQQWVEAIEKEKAKIIFAKSGQKIKSGKAVMEILFPLECFKGKQLKQVNDTSIVSRLVFGQNEFLLTGDIFKLSEKQIIETGLNITADVLKVAHHGSKTSSSEEFLQAVGPQLAVISVGKDNRYGHPDEEVLARLKDLGITVLRTDQEGDIKIISNGTNLKVKNRN